MQSFSCRVCGSEDPYVLLIGFYAPFFQLRADLRQEPFIQYWQGGRLAKELQFLKKVLLHGPKLLASQPTKLFRVFGALVSGRGDAKRESSFLPPHRTLMIYCPHCKSAMPCHDFSYEELSGLYHDYRGPTYNRDRISVEPAYAAIVDRVGNDPREVSLRNAAADAFLKRNAARFKRGIVLDYGGSDGQFVPPSLRDYFDGVEIVDVSDASLHVSVDANFVRKVSSAGHGKYSLVTNMHVVEHVGNPRKFVLEALQYVAPGGHLYIETPVELTGKEAADFGNKKIDSTIMLHEHINKYSPGSIAKLVESSGIAKVIDDSVDAVDQGWISSQISRTLAEKL